MVRVGCVQLAVNADEPIAARTERALAMTTEAAKRSDVVMLPELWPTGAFDLTLGIEHAEPIDGPLVGQLSDVAAKTSTWVHGGSFVEVDAQGEFFNTSVLFSPTGGLAAVYRKIHLFGFDQGEAALLTSGTDLVVVETPLGPTGLATCYDLRFPEMFRRLIDAGAQSVLLTSGWPTKRLPRWTLLAQARGAEDQIWFVGCNESGTHAGVELGGHSLVVDPWGEIVSEADGTETVLYAEVDPGYAAQVRTDFPVLRDRRL